MEPGAMAILRGIVVLAWIRCPRRCPDARQDSKFEHVPLQDPGHLAMVRTILVCALPLGLLGGCGADGKFTEGTCDTLVMLPYAGGIGAPAIGVVVMPLILAGCLGRDAKIKSGSEPLTLKDVAICQGAVEGVDWASAPERQKFVIEAERRKLSPEGCRRVGFS